MRARDRSYASAIPQIEHGGDLTAAAREFGIAEDQWLDLSTGINPLAYPLPRLSAHDWQALPTGSAVQGLKAAAAGFFGCSAESVLVAPGSQSVIQLMPQLLREGRAASEVAEVAEIAILSPTYGESARVFQSAGFSVRLDTTVVQGSCPLWITNPNNPDGRRLAPATILGWAAERPVIVDEAFVEVTPELSCAEFAGQDNLYILRSFGKFFGLAGLRLGFLLAAPEVVRWAEARLGPWAVSGVALRIATAAYRDESWIQATRTRLAAETERLETMLARRGVEVIGGTDLFTLVHHPRASLIHRQMARRGVLLRRFPDQPTWLRIGRRRS
ncbi:MAG: threonine-phosphate decarboxylase CobD [Alphaproteobacteria bacterium]|nr:threonine-phosphate decarboxylase CobD [Alphaproteobacteria bacterium]